MIRDRVLRLAALDEADVDGDPARVVGERLHAVDELRDAAEGAHPYTIASNWNEQQRRITFVTKELGDHTSALREKLLALLYARAANFFEPAEGAPAGAADRVAKASKSMNSLIFDTLVAWLEGSDGLSDEKRFVWFGRMAREWRVATREAYELDPPENAEKP